MKKYCGIFIIGAIMMMPCALRAETPQEAIDAFFQSYEGAVYQYGGDPTVAVKHIAEMRSRFNDKEFIQKSGPCLKKAKTDEEKINCVQDYFINFMQSNQKLIDDFKKKAKK